MSVESALQALRLDPKLMHHVVRWEHIPARPARTTPFPAALDDRLLAALRGRGIEALYTHQAAAVEAALRNENVAVATPAASGKTFCYNLPVLNRLLADPNARALYLFPTKALAQDQLAELRDLIGLLSTSQSSPTCATYDGDTPSGQRARVRDAARVILSNPDMLHAGILPQHPRWTGFFANLCVVVIDEMHVYRGVFGSHVANVLRRLRRICRFYGSAPQFILASATIANPGELAERLVEAPITLIDSELDGAPQGDRHLLFYNPPLVDPDLGIRRSSSQESADLAAHFLAHNVQTIVFAQSRLTTELILTYLQEKTAITPRPPGTRTAGRTTAAIRGYRGGYLPTERRAIEKGLRDGEVRAVVATNALELGIDIGRLDAAVLAGYPGTVASARQQLGRAGRRQAASIGVLVAGPTALDQYIVMHPAWLMGRSPEHARLNPDNTVLLAGHLACAAAELPLRASDLQRLGNPGDLRRLLDDLIAAGQLYRSGDRYFWAGEGSPATALSLRNAGSERVIIQTAGPDGAPQVIGEIEREGVPLLLYQGAVYLHEGATYLVERLDWEGGIAFVRPATVDFYTRPIISEKIELLGMVDYRSQPADEIQLPAASVQHAASGVQVAWGEVRVASQAAGYRIQRQGTNEVLGFGQVDLPPQMLETQACQLTFSKELIEELKAAGQWLSDPNAYGPNWPAQRAAARARDGYRCQGCGQPELNGRQHDVHHKAPFRAFVGDPARRNGLAADQAWQVANRLENLVTLCSVCHRQAEASVRTRTGLGGAGALLAGVAPLFLMCDPRDLGVIVEPQDPDSGLPTITIYEKTPGGVGYAEQLAASMPELLRAALDTVTACPCTSGCPACVGPILEHEYALDAKALTRALLEKVLSTSSSHP